MERKTKMVYVTKSVLTKGIEYLEVYETSATDYVKENIRWGRDFHKDDWFESKEEAIIRAEIIRYNKILSLKKQLDKLNSIKF